MSRLRESERLHLAVQGFAREALAGAAAADAFDLLLDDILQFQSRSLQHLAATPLTRRGQLPAPCPVDAFRVGSVFAFDEQLATACFETSGTTGAASGRHLMRHTQTYAALAVEWGRRALVPQDGPPFHVIALLPEPGPRPRSSLAFMCARFMEAFDHSSESLGGPRLGEMANGSDRRWLLGHDGIDLPSLRQHVRIARDSGHAILLLATSFSLVMLLDAIGEEKLPLPPGSVVMQTGGFKGKTREIPAHELSLQLREVLSPLAVVGEYGMTELSSQLYEGVVPGAALVGSAGLYVPPPWLRVLALDPATLHPVEPGATGLAAFVDLANVDSAAFVVTQDLVRVEPGGVALLGRRPRAPLRGCSLAAEALSSVNADARRSGSSQRRAARRVDPPAPTDGEAQERIQTLLRAARRVADPKDRLGVAARESWRQTTGLSPEAIELGIRCSLETQPSDPELQRLASSMPASKATWVLLSANVFVGAHRAIATALATSPRVYVRPSRRDPTLAESLHEAAPELFQLVTELQPAAGDHVHAYGSDETHSRLRAELPSDVVLHFHGSGLGAALIGRGADVCAAAEGLALDTVLFEQRGCLSPRLVVVDAQHDAEAFALRVTAQLAQWAQRVPQAGLGDYERADITWHRALAPHVGKLFDALQGSVLLHSHDARGHLIPPVGRNLVVVSSSEPETVLAELGAALTCVGCAADVQSTKRLNRRFPEVRICELGQMQRPPFDGPVDRRTKPTRR